MKASNTLFTIALIAFSVTAMSAPPATPGVGSASSISRGLAGRLPGSNRPGIWNKRPSSGIFAGDVVLFYDANHDGEVDLKDTNKAYAVIKSSTPGLTLRRGVLLKVGFSATARQPWPDTKLVRSPEFRDYKTVAGLEIKGINMMTKSGKFASLKDEIATCGRVLVWLDASRSVLMLDSANQSRRHVEWHLSEGPVPQFVYLEVVAAGRTGGAFRLTGSVDDSNQHVLADKFFGLRTAYDHLIINASN